MPSAPLGRLLAGRYLLLDQLGRGAMGIVWRGRDQLLDRDVAVKQIVLPPMPPAGGAGVVPRAGMAGGPGVVPRAGIAEAAQTSARRTLREARSAAKLNHPGVVTVFDVVEEDGTGWIVMELIRARPLDQVIAEDGPLPPGRAAQLGLALLDALSAAHAAGVLHRDVKPSNVLIRTDGTPTLTDFGIATTEGDPAFTQEGMVVGTPGFSPPERIRGAVATPASDLWSLGATLYAAVEGRGPFDRAGGSIAILASVATEPAPRAPSAGPLGPVIEALLRADPAERADAATAERMLSSVVVTATGAPDPAGPGRAAASASATTATQVVLVPDMAAPGPAVGAADGRPATGESGPGTASVVPDLLATPVFAELAMPGPAPAGQASPPGPAAPPAGAQGPQKVPIPLRSRRLAILAGALAAAGAVTAVVYFAFPGLSTTLAQGLAKLPGAAGPSPADRGAARHGPAAPPGQNRAPGHPASSPGAHRPDPTPPGSPNPSGSTSSGTPSASPSPSPGQRSLPAPPLGFAWQSVSASIAGTTAGFELAAPSTWLMTPGLLTVVQPPVGVARLRVSMARWAVHGPVREARHLQAVATAGHLYPHYHLLSILATTFHGRPAATWSFWWRPAPRAAAIDVVEVLYTALTPAGPQPYILSISAPAPRASWAGHIFRVAMRTFQPVVP